MTGQQLSMATAQNAHLRRMASLLRERGLAHGEYEDGHGRLDLAEAAQVAMMPSAPVPFGADALLARLVRRAMDEGLAPQGPIALEDVLPEAIALSDRIAAAHGHRDGAETLAALCEREAGAAP